MKERKEKKRKRGKGIKLIKRKQNANQVSDALSEGETTTVECYEMLWTLTLFILFYFIFLILY